MTARRTWMGKILPARRRLGWLPRVITNVLANFRRLMHLLPRCQVSVFFLLGRLLATWKFFNLIARPLSFMRKLDIHFMRVHFLATPLLIPQRSFVFLWLSMACVNQLMNSTFSSAPFFLPLA